jgi:acetolactate decarboxylase
MQHLVEYLRTLKRKRLHVEPAAPDEIFQVSTISALLQGVYDGDMTYADIARHGDFGVGTFNALDGEMVAFGNRFYQIKAGGQVNEVEPKQKTPFAVVMFFKPHIRMLCKPSSISEVCDQIDKNIESKNAFYAVKITGNFKYLKVRTVPRQEKPYKPMLEIVKDQPMHEYRDTAGTISGFRFPQYTQGMSVAGYHLHFLTTNRDHGGHVLDGNITDGHIELDHSSHFHLELPDEDEFLKADLEKGDGSAIEKVEGGF